MLTNLRSGKSEDGKKGPLTGEDKKDSIEFWSERRLRIIYSLANCAISQKVRVLIETLFSIYDPNAFLLPNSPD